MTAVLAAVGGKSMWYLTRGSGVVALLLLTAAVVLGLLSSVRWESKRWPRFVVEGMHRNVSLVVLVFLAIHIVTTVVDGFVPIAWLDVVVPFRAGYRPVWVGLGTLAVDCLLAIVVTSLFRVRIGHRVWRAVHWLAYACWPIALVHGLGTGTDSPQAWMLALDAASVASVLGVLWWRIAVRRPAHRGAAPAALAASFVVLICVGLFAWRGPLAPGWGSHGGRLGASSADAGPNASGPVAGSAQPPQGSAPPATAPNLAATLPIDASISGTRRVSAADGLRTITLAGRSADPDLSVEIDLTGPPDSSGGISLRSGVVRITFPGSAAAWTGPVIALRDTTITATLTGADGAPIGCSLAVAINRSAETWTGTVHLVAGTN